MELRIAPTKLLIAILACIFSIVSTTDYLISDDVDRITRNDAALTEALHLSRRSASNDTPTNATVKHHDVIIEVTGDPPDTFDFEHPPEYENIIPKHFVWNLYTSDRFAENVLSIFGNILESSNSGLNSEQYYALRLIYNAIKGRQFPVYHLLRVLKNTENEPRVSQLRIVLVALSEVLPPYLASAANFLVSQIDQQLCDTQTLLSSVTANMDFLTGISDIGIKYGSLHMQDMEQNGYDEASRSTESIVGPFFVNIFALMSKETLVVSQPLFAGILLHLPNHDGCPVFNEYVRFVARIASEGRIPNWSKMRFTPTTGTDISVLVNTMIGKICRNADVSYDLKQALWYIRNHYANSVQRPVTQAAHEAYRVCDGGIHMRLLFGVITPEEFSPHAIRLKAQLLKYIGSHQDVVREILVGMNTYGYTRPEHLLLAFLARLRTLLPDEEIEIRHSVSALLSILMLKRQAWNVSWPHKGGVTIWSLLEAINDPRTNPKMAEYGQMILAELLEKNHLWGHISRINRPSKNKCYSTEVCLRTMLQILVETLSPNSLSPETYTIIKQLIDMITDEIERPAKITAPTSKQPLMCPCPTTLQPHITTTITIPTEKSSMIYHTTAAPFTAFANETTSVKPSVHETTTATPANRTSVGEQTTTLHPEITTSTGPTSTVPPVHNYTTTAERFTSVAIETTSEKLVVNETTSTIQPHITTTNETASEGTPVSVHTTTVHPETITSTGPTSTVPVPYNYTTTAGPFTPAVIETTSEKESVIGNRTTTHPHIPITIATLSNETLVGEYTVTLEPEIITSTGPTSTVSLVHNYTTTAGPFTPVAIETTSEEGSVIGNRTTTHPHIPITIATLSNETLVGEYTVTLEPEIITSTGPTSTVSPVHNYTTTAGPFTPVAIETTSEQALVNGTTTHLFPITSNEKVLTIEPVGNYPTALPQIKHTEPTSTVPPAYNYTTAAGPFTPVAIETTSEKLVVNETTSTIQPHITKAYNYTTAAGPFTPVTIETTSEKLVVNETTSTIQPHITKAYNYTTAAGPFTPVAIETTSEKLVVNETTSTIQPHITKANETASEGTPVSVHTTTVHPEATTSTRPTSTVQPVHHYTTISGPFTPAAIETTSEKAVANETTSTIQPHITTTNETASKGTPVSVHTTTVHPETITITVPTSMAPPVYDYTTTAGPFTTATNATISPESTVYHSTITFESRTPFLKTTTYPSVLEHSEGDEEEVYPIITRTFLPPTVNPEEGVCVAVPDSGVTSKDHLRFDAHCNSSDTVITPSIVCLNEKLNTRNLDEQCEKDVLRVTRILKRVFGEDYTEVLLGEYWRDRYDTRLSWLHAVLEKAEKSDKVAKQPDDLREIKKYKEAIRHVSSQVFLLLVIGAQNITAETIWMIYSSEPPAQSYIDTQPPHELGRNVTVLPLVNPIYWRQEVDAAHPFEKLLPQLSPNDPYRQSIQPLQELFETGKIYQYLGSDWNPSQYANRGDLFVSVLHILLKVPRDQLSPELYAVVRNHLIVIERPSLYIEIPRQYINTVIEEYHIRHGTSVQIPPSTVVHCNGASIEMFEEYISHPSARVFPLWMDPGTSIHVDVSDPDTVSIVSDDTPVSPDVVVLPSFDCLLGAPIPEHPSTRCQRDLIPITQPLSHMFGRNYVEKLLGNNWEDGYQSRISLLTDLLWAAKSNERCQNSTELISMIDRYMAACQYVSANVLTPVIVDSQHLNTITVWLTYDFAHLSAPAIGSHPEDEFDANKTSFPLLNPKIWWQSVDYENPFAYLLPCLPKNDSHLTQLQPLFSLFESGEINKLLGSSWQSSDYPDKGTLFVAVLRKLATLDVVKSDQYLYNLVNNYLLALELLPLYTHVPQAHVMSIFDRYNITYVEERYIESFRIPNHIPLPPLINPSKTLQVIIPESGAPVVESVRSKKLQSKVAMILPSVNCLQGASNAEYDDAEDTCDSVLEFRLTEPLIEVFGDDYVEKIMGDDWSKLYPTRISFLAGLLRNAVKNQIVMENSNLLLKKVKPFKEALEVAAPYIFLPMLANYEKLFTPIVWLTYNYDRPWLSHMGRNPPQYADNSSVTLPLINPKIWFEPLNKHHPFSGFLPDFPPTNPYERKIAPLRSLLTLENLRSLTGGRWDIAQYPNRGTFFVSAMHTLLKLGPTRMKPELYSLVRSYYMAIEIPSLYIHIPRSYIRKLVKDAEGVWSVNLVGLMVALAEAKTAEQRRYRAVLEIWLADEHLLEQLAIRVSSLTTTKAEFLMTIIKAALSSKTIELSEEIRSALLVYQELVVTTGAGAEVIEWKWYPRYIKSIQIDLVTLVKSVIPIERIPEKDRDHFNNLLTFFEQHYEFQVTEFPAYRYHTRGALVRGYFNHLLNNVGVDEEVQKNIEVVIPFIRYTGPGAVPISHSVWHWAK